MTTLDCETQTIESINRCRLLQRLTLHQNFERNGIRIELRRVELRVWLNRSRVVASHRLHTGTPARHDRCTCVFALELADLPLSRQHPERIVDTSGKSDVDARPRSARLDTCPIRNRWHVYGANGLRSVETASPFALNAR